MTQPLIARLPRHTRFVGAGKRTLWLLAALLAALLLLFSWKNGGDAGTRVVLSSAAPGPAEPAVMSRPHYLGLDEKNQPFTILADRATQPNSNTVVLDNLSADMTDQNQSWVALKASKGIYDSPSKHLHLTDNADMFYESGYEFRSAAADVDMNAGTASGDAHVEGQGPAGILEADSFKVLDRGKVLQFNGHVYVKLYR